MFVVEGAESVEQNHGAAEEQEGDAPRKETGRGKNSKSSNGRGAPARKGCAYENRCCLF